MATYETWSRQAGCRVVSLFHYAHGFEDLHSLKRKLHHASGLVVDKYGIDWWDVVLPMLYSDLECCMMLLRLAKELGNPVRLYCSRSDARASALQKFLGIDCLLLEGSSIFTRKVQHYRNVFSHLDFNQLTQIVQDKFDPEHSMRRRLARKKSSIGRPVFLLPTAYINVSRAAISYAALLPQEQFLLVVARPGGEVSSLSPNVGMISLDPYFDRQDEAEFVSLMDKWGTVQTRLVPDFPDLRMADVLGVFQRVPKLMRWGIAVRDAWARLFESENIAACLSADDANPYTSLPLFLAKQRGIPTLAVHHGALDYRMALKTLQADFYLAKGELERDYLLHTCGMDPERIFVGSPPPALPKTATQVERSWLVFFTEPYGSGGWRMEEVYRDLLPRLCRLAKDCELKLIFKLHPFESIKGHQNLLRKLLPQNQFNEIQCFAGLASSELWDRARFAMTVESTIALECAIRRIPIFLCAWLQSAYGDYLRQYAKFEVGHILNAPDEIQSIPKLLKDLENSETVSSKIWQTLEPSELRNLLTGAYRSAIATQVGTLANPDHF